MVQTDATGIKAVIQTKAPEFSGAILVVREGRITADLRSFSEALFGGRLLKSESLAAMMRPGLDEYGYGVWIYRDEIGGHKYTTVMRPGQIMGTNCVLYHVVEPSLTIIALSNTDRSNVDALALAITKAVLGAR